VTITTDLKPLSNSNLRRAGGF